MIQLRPYQQDAITSIRSHFARSSRKVILCLPTGAGKTVTFADLVGRTLQKNFSARCLILTHRIELLTQAGGTLEKFGIRYETIAASNKRIKLNARCYVGMVETYYKRIQKHPELLNIDLVIIDEAHTGNFKKLFDFWAAHNPNLFVIGATATPISAKKSDPLSNYYDAIVCPVQIPELIDDGFLVPAITYSVNVDTSALEKDWTGDYSDASQMDVFAKRAVYAGLIDKYQQFCVREGAPVKAIVFNVNVEHSIAVAREFNQAGIPCKHIDANTDPFERESIIAGFKAGVWKVLCNVGILNAGFDDPTVGAVIVNRATTSLALWLQMCGRGSRLAEGKTHFVVLDMGKNYADPNLGLWEKPRDWTKLWCKQAKNKEGEGIAPVKDCPEETCGAINPISAKVCISCGFEFPVKEQEAAPEAEFVEVSNGLELLQKDRKANWPTLPVSDLFEIHKLKARSPEWMVHVIRDRSQSPDEYRSQLIELAKLKGYKAGWVHHKVLAFQRPTP